MSDDWAKHCDPPTGEDVPLLPGELPEGSGPEEPDILLRLRVLPGDRTAAVRLRKLLKYAKKFCGLTNQGFTRPPRKGRG